MCWPGWSGHGEQLSAPGGPWLVFPGWGHFPAPAPAWVFVLSQASSSDKTRPGDSHSQGCWLPGWVSPELSSPFSCAQPWKEPVGGPA